MTTTTTEALRQTLLDAKLGGFLTWTVPDLEQTVGPCDLSPFLQHRDARTTLIQACRDRLAQYSEQEIAVLAAGRADPPDATWTEWSRYRHDAISRLTRDEPPWYAGGFGHPDHRADIDYWSKMSGFSVAELLCLSVGIDPADFSDTRLAELQKRDPTKLWLALQFLLRRHDQLQRQFRRSWPGARISAREFLAWVEQVSFEVDPEFLRLLRQHHAENPKPAPMADTTRGVDKREVDMIAQLFTAMAISQFGYRPDHPKSPIPKEITEIVASLGLSISTDTIRKYLKRGAELLSAAAKPD